MSTHYSISWIYDKFVFCEFSHNKCVSTWLAPEPVRDVKDFASSLKAMKVANNIKRYSSLTLVYKSELQTHAFLEMPPMSKKDAQHYLSRNVEKEKTFDAEAIWSYRSALKGRLSKGALLNFMPKDVFNEIVNACEKAKFDLGKLLPFTEIIGQRVAKIPTKENEIIVVVVLIINYVEIVVTDERGDVFFVRDLHIQWDVNNLDRLQRDIERTLLYTKQQNAHASQIILMGANCIEVATLLKHKFSIPVNADPVSMDDNFWVNTALAISDRSSSNFIGQSIITSLMRRASIGVGVCAATASVAIAITTALVMNNMRLEGNEQLLHQVNTLENKLSELRVQYSDMSEEQQTIDVLLETNDPIPVLFLYDLGNLVPDTMVLSKAEMALREGKWEFTLEGANIPTLATSVTELEQLEDALQSGQWRANVSSAWREAWLEKLQQGKANDQGLIAFKMEGNL